MSPFETILVDKSVDGVLTVTLNRPDRMNAFNPKMADEFVELWADAREDDAVRAIVLRAAGDKAFCTGVDVKEGFPRDPKNPWKAEDISAKLGPKSNRVWKPVVCAIHGLFAGGAFYFMNEADIVICSEDAAFFDPHITFGMVSACEPIGLLGRVPYGDIMRIVLMGNDERVLAPTALRIGLVTEVTPREKLWPRAHEIASGIATKPAVAVQGSVRAIWEARDVPPALAVLNALKYTQMGNPIGTAQVDRATAPKARWTPR